KKSWNGSNHLKSVSFGRKKVSSKTMQAAAFRETLAIIRVNLRLISVQKQLPIQRVSSLRHKPRVANHPPQLFFCGAVSNAGGAHNVFFQHHRAKVIAAKAQPQLADFQALRDPTGLHVLKIR